MSDWTTPDLCDAHHPDRVAVVQPGLLRTFGGREAFAGPVETVACFEDNSEVKRLGDEPGAGRVLVVDGGGSLRKALLGDLIAARYVENGWVGLVIHGAVRDVEVLRGLDLGVQAIAPCPVRTEKRGLGDVGVPLTFGGVTVRPGQWVYADVNGVLVSDVSLA